MDYAISVEKLHRYYLFTWPPPFNNLVPVNTYNSLYKETWDHQDDDRHSGKIIKKAKYQYFFTPCHSMVLLIFQLQRLNPFPPLPFLKEGRSRYSLFCFSYIKDTSSFSIINDIVEEIHVYNMYMMKWLIVFTVIVINNEFKNHKRSSRTNEK